MEHGGKELIFVGSGRVVTALDRFSGRTVWRQKLPRMFGGFLTIAATEREVYAGRGGYVYCFDAHSGQPLWERGLQSGGGMVMMAMSGQGMNDAPAFGSAQQAMAGAAASSAAASAG